MATKLWGPMLTGLAQGFGDYQQQQEDLAYTRQARMNQLAGQQLENQSRALQNQQQQQVLQNATLTAQFAQQGLQDAANPSDAGQQAAYQAVPAGGAQVVSAASNPARIAYGNFKPQGPLSVQQLSGLDEKYGLPTGTAYGLMAAESAGNPNAVSPKGAQGLFQVMPSTAAQPGYGLKAFDPKDPDGALSYFAKLYQKAGGDMTKALAYWNAGPGGNPNNPETQGFIPRVQKNAQLFAASQQLDQSKRQPTPADQMNAVNDAGVAAPVTAYQRATQAQNQQIQAALASAKRAEQAGYPQLAQQFYTRANQLQEQQVELQTKTLGVQKAANTEVANLASGVKDQDSYNNLRRQLQQNPAMQSAVAGLNLTGDYSLDRNKLQTLAERTLTLKDQQDLSFRNQELQLKQQQAQREQQKADAPKIAQQQAIAADENRQKTLKQSGIPFAPSIAATAPVGTTTQQMQQASQAIQKANAAALQKTQAGDAANKQITQLTTQLIGLLDKPNPVTTGGLTRIPGVGALTTTFEPDRQLFDKVSNQLITSMQNAQASAGGGRSSFTAAMFDRIKVQKPNLDLAPDVNRQIGLELYAGAAVEQNRASFVREYLQANPDAPVASAQVQWANYEQSLGPSFIVDATAPDGFRPNFAGVPKLPDGRPNPNYKDYHDYFRGNQ